MITAWILYSILVGSLAGAGALVLDHVLRTLGLPSRWVWVGAMVFSVGWPLGHWAGDTRPQALPVAAQPSEPALEALPEIPATVIPLVEPMALEVTPDSVLRLLDGPLLVAWALTSLVLVLSFALLVLRTHHLRRHWRRGKVEGERVLFSDEWGPAVVGFFRPQIVLPSWSRDLEPRALRFILEHEGEHVRAGDLRLMVLAGALPVLFPWHLPVWWQLTRLRGAVEGDCDLRVLGRNPGQTRPYVNLLLEVGERCSRPSPLVAMLSEPFNALKRRIKIMTMRLPRKPWVRGGLLAGTGVFLVALAGLAPGPTEGKLREGGNPQEVWSPTDAGGGQEMTSPPVFTPFKVYPSIRNREAVVRVLEREYPPALRDAGIGGTARMAIRLDEEGRVRDVVLEGASGHDALDRVALRAADIMEFTPALNRDQRVSVWVSLPVEFKVRDRGGLEETGARTVAASSAGSPSDAQEAGEREREMGEIAGIIRDAQTGRPMAGVQVFVMGTQRGTLSNPDGRFLVRHVPVGEREVVADLIGYGRMSQRVMVTTNAPAEASFDLSVTPIPMEGLVVWGIRGGAPSP